MMEQVSLEQLQAQHSITARFRCDLWRTPTVNDYDAPIKYARVPFSRFRRARVTVSAAWKTKFDQGGLLLALLLPPPPPPALSSSSSSMMKTRREGQRGADDDGKDEADVLATAKWVKAGIEFLNGQAFASTVVTDTYSDWSLTSSASSTSSSSSSSSLSSLTLELEREISEENGQPTNTLWVYLLDPDTVSGGGDAARRVPCREVSWLFSERPPRDEMLLGTYAAKVTRSEGGGDGELEVVFSDFQLDLAPA